MARHVWSILCRKAAVDKADNALSIFDVVEQITFGPNEPEKNSTIPFPFTLVSFWINQKDRKKQSFKVRVFGPTGKQLGENEIKMDFDGKPRLRTMVQLGGIQYFLL